MNSEIVAATDAEKARFLTIDKFTIDFHKELGKGKFGKVYYTTMVDANQKIIEYACKIIELPQLTQQTEQNQQKRSLVKYYLDQFNHEVEAMKNIQSSNVIKVLYAFNSSQKLFCVVPLCNGGDMDSFLRLRKRLDEEEAKIFLRQIVQGLKDMNEAKYMHRDLKLANILMHFPDHNLLLLTKQEKEEFIKKVNLKKVQFRLVISDLGFAKKTSDSPQKNTICGTLLYMPPQQAVQLDQYYSEKFDIWSLGIIFYQLLTGTLIFYGKSVESFKNNLNEGSYKFSENLIVSPEAIHLMSKCLQTDETERISIFELFVEPYIWDHKMKIINHHQDQTENVPADEQTLFSAYDQIKFKRNKITLSCKKSYSLEEIKEMLFTKIVEEEEKTLENIRNQIFDRISFHKSKSQRPLSLAHPIIEKRESIALNNETVTPIFLNEEVGGAIGDYDEDFDSDNEDVLVLKCKQYKDLFAENTIQDYFK